MTKLRVFQITLFAWATCSMAILVLWVMLTKPFPEQTPVMSPKTETQPTAP